MNSENIGIEIWYAHNEAASAVSNLREKCYKLASACFHAGDEAGQKAAYALADKYQLTLEVLNEIEISRIRETENATLPGGVPSDGWGDEA